MEINWKELSKSNGYRSLKAAYIRDVQDAARRKAKGYGSIRDKQEFLDKFNWVINRAQHYAYHQNRSIIDVLNEWESGRNYWWLSYYQDCNQPKINRKEVFSKPSGVNAAKKRHKKDLEYYRKVGMPTSKRRLSFNFKYWFKSKKEPPRWSKERKERHKRYGY